MKYKYTANNPERYATNLRRDVVTKNLIWDNARGQDVLIVQTPFGQSANELMESICEVLSKMEKLPREFEEILSGVWIKCVTATDKAKYKGCPLNGEASTYTVFSYHIENEVCFVYEPQNQAMICAYCDIPLELHVEVKKETRQKGLFKKHEVDTGFYCIVFPMGYENSYIEGDMSYSIGEMVIPITRQMLTQRTVYVKSAVAPSVQSNNAGLRLV